METKEGALNFSSGLLSHYEPSLKNIQQQLTELTSKQKSMLNEIEAENLKYSAINTNELNSMFCLIKDYHIRLMNVKKEMTLLAEKSVKLKKRALRVQEQKQKEALEDAHYREAQLKREQDLIARPAPASSKPSFGHPSKS